MSGFPRICASNPKGKSYAGKGISFGFQRRSVFLKAKNTTTKSTHDDSHGNISCDEKNTKETYGQKFAVLKATESLKLDDTSKKSDVKVRKSINDNEGGEYFDPVFEPLQENYETNEVPGVKMSDHLGLNNAQLCKILREKDREISRLRETIRKASSDRETATCATAQTRMRVAELRTKLSNQKRRVEHVTSVERLRCREKVSNETERLRHERDEARGQLEQHEKLVWHLRKQVEQLGYLSRQRYKTIQELNRKMAMKDKSIQEMRKRMEQAQFITIPGTNTAERRHSINNAETKTIKWDAPGRLATVTE